MRLAPHGVLRPGLSGPVYMKLCTHNSSGVGVTTTSAFGMAARSTALFHQVRSIWLPTDGCLAVSSVCSGALAAGLGACGVAIEETRDSLIIHGTGTAPSGDNCVATHMDHRIAMSFLVLGMVTAAPVTVDDATPIATSFPGFVSLMNDAGACFEEGGAPS